MSVRVEKERVVNKSSWDALASVIGEGNFNKYEKQIFSRTLSL